MKQWQRWDLPFFDAGHDALAQRLQDWLGAFPDLEKEIEPLPLGEQCSVLVKALGHCGLLEFAVPRAGAAGQARQVDVRSICLIREALSYRSALADFAFSMQGIGTAAIWLFGSAALQEQYLDACRDGNSIAALALSELEGGSDVAATATHAERDGDTYILNGAKTWISNGGIAHHYIVVARTETAPGSKGLSAFLVDAETSGLSVGSNIDVVAPHPLSEVRFDDCKVPASRMLGAPGEGFKVAMATLDIFRSSVGAAAVGLARRALDETVARMHARSLFGKKMAQMDTVRSRIADMALDLESAALLVYRAGWLRDVRGLSITREAAMAKLGGTEGAFRVIDSAVQLFGALGITEGCIIERLFRDIRPMRIYEGASEIQKLIIGKKVLADGAPEIQSPRAP